jgi:hypothetical protein
MAENGYPGKSSYFPSELFAFLFQFIACTMEMFNFLVKNSIYSRATISREKSFYSLQKYSSTLASVSSIFFNIWKKYRVFGANT